MFSLRNTLANRRLPRGYNINMGVAVLCGRRPVSITCLPNSPCPQSVTVHFKSLLPIDNAVNQFIDTQFIVMQKLFAEGYVAVLRGTTEDLSGNQNLQLLQNLNVGSCVRGQTTRDQNNLFANRNNVGRNELVVYIVSTLIGGSGNFVGCAAHPNGQPGVVVVQINARWLTAHEVGHVLGLRHVSGSDHLMFPNIGWINVPPNLADSEYTTMQDSGFTNRC